jgi:hypothetical protein
VWWLVILVLFNLVCYVTGNSSSKSQHRFAWMSLAASGSYSRGDSGLYLVLEGGGPVDGSANQWDTNTFSIMQYIPLGNALQLNARGTDARPTTSTSCSAREMFRWCAEILFVCWLMLLPLIKRRLLFHCSIGIRNSTTERNLSFDASFFTRKNSRRETKSYL